MKHGTELFGEKHPNIGEAIAGNILNMQRLTEGMLHQNH